jgi:replicative DNA helicase
MDLIRDKHLERVALRIMMENPDARHLFSPDMFSTPQNVIIFEKILKAAEGGAKLDRNLLISYLNDNDQFEEVGELLVDDLFSFEYDVDFINEYAKKLAEISLLRNSQLKLATLASGISKFSIPELISEIDNTRQFIIQKVDITDEDNSIDTLLTREMPLILDGSSASFIKTGFEDFDSLIGGLERSDLVILAARPSIGKTALMLRWVVNMAVSGVPCEIYSYEMSSSQIIRRILSMESGVPTHRLQSGAMSEDEKETLRKVVTRLKPIPLSFRYSVGQNLADLANHIRLSQKVNNTEVFAVDYAQLMTLTPGQETQDLNRIAATLKNIAVELNIVIILVSQFNRSVEARKNKHPMLSDLRQAGGLEESADKVIFPFREFYYSKAEKDIGLAEISVAKNRNGPIAEFHLMFNEETTNFWV